MGIEFTRNRTIDQQTPLSHFQQLVDNEVLIADIVIIVLETRFVSYSSLLHGVVQKARQRLRTLLGNDELLEAICQQF